MSQSSGVRRTVQKLLRPPHVACLLGLAPGATVLDIGCGNHSPSRTKALRPDIVYVGADVAEYNLSEADHRAADELAILPAQGYAHSLRERFRGRRFDLIYLKHVIEHTDAPFELLAVLPDLLADGGHLYLSFPSEASIGFPSAENTLNFYDDPGHLWIPSVREILNRLSSAGLRPVLVRLRHHHPVYAAVGVVELVLQWLAWPLRRRLHSSPAIWSVYGFESILVLRKAAGADQARGSAA
jgi:2-polyprenyl-3-methyl-5-hydroxy-6-metoxy-1,4-benzoquinol methylase